ncbi:hypothetical protein OHA25_08540 [Nonomuraea sp. NBC_00507]|uniref:hypothetical protein n=1 Tax=Nonomuraea sp. NBC_00507 TaxID=2976002 RepID=UPI002E18CABE
MKIKMMTLYASAERSVQAGEIALFPNEEAEALIEGGYAVPVDVPADGEQVRTRPVPQPPKAGQEPKTPAKAPAKTPAKAPAKTAKDPVQTPDNAGGGEGQGGPDKPAE